MCRHDDTGMRHEEEMKVDGRCHCEAIRYEAEIDPQKVSICHCTDCQTLTGSVYRVSVPVAAGDFALLSGNPKIYVKTAQSGNKRAQAFCRECGTPIYAADAENPRYFALRVGTLTQRAELPAKLQIWCQSALPWISDIRDIVQSDRG
jgi:hypothetical protein